MLHAQAGLHVRFVCIQATERETCPGRYAFAERCWRCRADVALGVDIVVVGGVCMVWMLYQALDRISRWGGSDGIPKSEAAVGQ